MSKEKTENWKELCESNTGNAQANIELSISARNLINLDLLSKVNLKLIILKIKFNQNDVLKILIILI